MGSSKAGQSSLIGNAGEHYVMAELLKRRVIAALAPRNAPAFDILATKEDQTVRVRVKTKSQECSVWQWVAKKDGTIFKSLSSENDFTVLVDLAMDNADLKFYVVPTREINAWLKADFEEWVKTPGKRGRPHNPENTKRNLDHRKYRERLESYLNRWRILWEE